MLIMAVIYLVCSAMCALAMRFSQEQKREERELFQAAISSRAADSNVAVVADAATP